MSYVPTTNRRRYRGRQRPPRPALSGVLDLFDKFDFFQALPGGHDRALERCSNSDELVSTRDGMDAQIASISASWNPTGFYTAADIKRAIDIVFSQAGPVGSAALEVAGGVRGQADEITPAHNAFSRAIQDGNVFTQAKFDAESQGIRVIEAPGLKPWVLDVMQKIRDLAVAVSVSDCAAASGIQFMVMSARVLVAIGDVVKQIVGTVIEVGEKVLKAVGGIGQLLGFVMTHLPAIAVIGGGAYLLLRFQKGRKSSST